MKLLGWLSRAHYLFFLRSVFISASVVWLIFFFIFRGLNQSLKWSLLFSSILSHQIICAFAVPFLHTITDLIWLVCNVLGLIFYAWFEQISWEVNPWAGQFTLIHAILCYYLVGALPLLALIRVAFIFDAGFRTLIQPFDLLSDLEPGWKENLGGIKVLFGNSIWRSHFTGETRKLIFARGSFAALFLSGIVAFSLVKVLTEPIRELRLIPTQNIRTPDTYTPIQDSNSDAATWGVIIGKAFQYDPNNFTTDTFAPLRSAVGVTPLWDNPSNPLNSDCVYLESEDGEYYDSTIMITYYCPPRIPIENATSGYDILPQPYQDFQPDLLVTVNFSALGTPTNTIRDIPTNSVQVMVAMTNRTDDVVLMTTPTTLMAGVNLIGLLSYEIHQKFTNPGLSLFGLFESTQSTVIGQIVAVFPDPQAGTSPLVIRSPEIATIRLIGQSDASQWIIIQDSKERSFLNGLSQTGGLWTFLSGIFAAIFGSSLMRILFGTKPVSIFGIAHSWERKTIQRAYREDYPAITEEINVPQDRRGLLCLLQDHILDLNLIEGIETKQEFSPIPKDVVELDDFERGPKELPDQAKDAAASHE